MRSLHLATLFTCIVTTTATAQKPRDLSKLDPCKILTSPDLATATKGKVSKVVGGGVGANACMWVIDAPTGAGTYQFMFGDLALIEMVQQAKTPAERGSAVSGPWTEGWMTAPGAPRGDQYILVVIKRGELAFEVHGVDKDAVIALGRTASTRLK